MDSKSITYKPYNFVYQFLNKSYRGKCLLKAYVVDANKINTSTTKTNATAVSNDNEKDDSCNESDEDEYDESPLLFKRVVLCNMIIENEFLARGFQ